MAKQQECPSIFSSNNKIFASYDLPIGNSSEGLVVLGEFEAASSDTSSTQGLKPIIMGSLQLAFSPLVNNSATPQILACLELEAGKLVGTLTGKLVTGIHYFGMQNCTTNSVGTITTILSTSLDPRFIQLTPISLVPYLIEGAKTFSQVCFPNKPTQNPNEEHPNNTGAIVGTALGVAAFTVSAGSLLAYKLSPSFRESAQNAVSKAGTLIGNVADSARFLWGLRPGAQRVGYQELVEKKASPEAAQSV